MRKVPYRIDRIFFLFSPFLSLPLVLRGVFYQNKTSFVLFCLCIGFISFGYTPMNSDDKAYYIHLYNVYKIMPITEFFSSYLQLTTDVLFYITLYLAAYFNLPFEFFSLLVTFITCYLILSVFYEQSLKISKSKRQEFLFFIIAVLAISLPNLFSGMRNYLSVAFVFYGFNLLVNKEKPKNAFIFIFLGVTTHFSSFLYIAVVLIYYLINKKVIKIIFFMSLFFLVLPKSYLLNILSIFSISDVYSVKANVYLGNNSPAENTMKVGNLNNYIRMFINGLWFYAALVFSFLNIKNTNKQFLFFLCLMVIMNFVSSSIDLLSRYSLLTNLAFLSTLFFVKDLKYKKFFIYCVLIINLLTFYGNFMVVKQPLTSSLIKIEYLTMPTIFFIDSTTSVRVSK